MEHYVFFTTHAEYEAWIIDNKDKIRECIYLKLLDVPFKELQLSARAYNALRINRMNYMSDIIFLSADDIADLDMMSGFVLDEILMFKRNYLKKYKRTFVEFMGGIEDAPVEAVAEAPTEESFVEENTVAEETEADIESAMKAESVFCAEETLLHVRILLADSSAKEKISRFFELSGDIVLSETELSNRVHNCLKRGKIQLLSQAILLYPDEFISIRNMGKNSVAEICEKIEKMVASRIDEILCFINDGVLNIHCAKQSSFEEETDPYKLSVHQLINEEETDPYKLSVHQLIKHPVFKDKAIKYLTEKDISVDLMGLSNRAVNALMCSGIHSFYESLSIYPDKIKFIKNIGDVTVNDIKSRIEYYSDKFHSLIAAYCNGESNSLYSDEFIYDKVNACFKDVGFKGLSFNDIREEISEDIEDSRIKSCIGGMIADKKLEYVDFRLYRIYPSIISFIAESSLKDEDKNIVTKRLSGMTLESVAQEYGLTRERIRQKVNNTIRKLKGELRTQYEIDIFDEDYYSYLYSEYEGRKKLWFDFLNVDNYVLEYLSISYSKGNRPIADALADDKVDLILKFKIQDYLNRNKILIDGRFVEKQRSEIEIIALEKVCRDELTFDQFAEQYNELLQANGIEYDEKIYYTEEVRRTRGNHLSASLYCLWKQGERLRYYDINGQDYSELLETLNLGCYKNIEISTLKFIEDYPELMLKYDIRDQYELHNLLKKIINENDYNDIDFRRQPVIRFGEFDRDKAIYDILEAVAPVSIMELAEYVQMEYGYDKMTAMSSYFRHLNQFYHNGMYSIDFKKIPEDRIQIFQEKLTEDFYYVSEIKKLYRESFGDVDLEEINPLSLKAMGFKVYTTYAVQHFANAEAYFTHILTEKDVYDISALNAKFLNLSTYSAICYKIRQNYDVLLFDRNQAITMTRLKRFGITKEGIKEFCDEVYDFVSDNLCFTIKALRSRGFSSEIDELGFDDYFYAGIIAMDNRFNWQKIFGEIVLAKKSTENDNLISVKSFLLECLSRYDSVELDEFMDDCFFEYGVKISDKHKVTSAVAGTDFYYDSIMDKIYSNKNYYYSEFDD